MTIDTAGISSPLLTEYAAISIHFDVTSVLLAQEGADGAFVLTERRVEPPYVKDYDAIGDRPQAWATRFDTSRWGLFLARAEGRSLGGATVAFGPSGLDMLEGRHDLAVLWDIRVAPDARGQGVGRALFEAAETWALERGCRELKIETQNVNVAACRFYAAMGCQLRVVREHAYPECPGEAQFMFYKTLRA
jgi:GNAT superfamily N-acetyltransferase